MSLHVNEIFYSLQGEGGRTGEASIFIRLTGCNLSCDFCDTDFESGERMTVEEIHDQMVSYPCRWIIWTGGEPTLQLTDAILRYFKEKGYKQAIESNGTKKISGLIDYIVCSPKENFSQVKNRNPKVNEIRLPVKSGDKIPSLDTLPAADKYYLSPVFSKSLSETQTNIRYCVEQIKRNPQWILSIQTHKLIGIK